MQRLRVRSVLFALGTSLGVFMAATAAGAETPATAPATQAATEPGAHDAAFFDQLMRHLKLAAAARHDLRAMTPADEDTIKRLAHDTADPDVRALLQARIEELDEERALNPEPISVEFKDATFADVLLKLGKATGVTFQNWGGGPPALFTLSAHREPFWQIFTELSRQHPLRVQQSDRPQILSAEGSGSMTRCVLLPSGFAIFPISITRSSDVEGQANANAATSEQMQFTFILAADPRMKGVHMLPTVFTDIRDDAGNNLLNADDGIQAAYSSYNSNQQIVFESGVGLALPAKRGTRIVSAKGHVQVIVALGENHIDVDPAKSLNKLITLGVNSATITQFKVQNNTIQFSIQSMGRGGGNGGLTVAFIDANDQTVWSTQLNSGCGGSAGGNFVEPVKVRFSMPRAIKTLTIPFELKDLPLP